jgi:hypothetical protein
MTAPVIYDVTTDSFRPVTQGEVDAMMRRLNAHPMRTVTALSPIDSIKVGGVGPISGFGLGAQCISPATGMQGVLTNGGAA